MNEPGIITGNDEEEIWSQVSKDLSGEDIFDYNVLIEQGSHKVAINIDIDLGGGFEGGYELTTITSPLDAVNDFRFALHKEHFLDEIGKFFGMQDVVIGHPEFDKHVVVKTNDETKVKELFADEGLRAFLESLEEDFTFGVTTHDHKKVLEFSIEKGVIDPVELRTIYHLFYGVLDFLS